MRLLLDTHIVLWWLADDAILPQAARDAIADPENDVAVSAATAWEIAIKRSLGKLEAPDDLETALDAVSIESVDITMADALHAGSLPLHHTDPFDRMLIAQAQRRGTVVVTVDPRFAEYGVPLLDLTAD